MCGRFALFASPELVAEYFALAEPPSLAPHYNLTPGQDIAAVRVDRDGVLRLSALRWGLVPFWAKDADDRPTPDQRAARQPRRTSPRSARRSRAAAA